MQEPRVILADEPIASLDPLNAAIVMDALKAINASEGLTVMCNLHTLDTARTYCSRVIGMMAGRVVFDGPASDLTNARVRDIYGAEGEAELSEAVTSTALPMGPDTPIFTAARRRARRARGARAGATRFGARTARAGEPPRGAAKARGRLRQPGRRPGLARGSKTEFPQQQG